MLSLTHVHSFFMNSHVVAGFVTLIVFWVPRRLKDMMGLTTNVEFGLYVRGGRVVYGRPDWAERNKYLDFIYLKVQGKAPFNNLSDLLKHAVNTYSL